MSIAPSRPTLAPRRTFHSWTNDELNLVALRRSHRWTFDRIRKTDFPSLSKIALMRAYGRLPAEELIQRASTAAASLSLSHGASRFEDPVHLNPSESSRPSHPASRHKGNTKASKPSTPRHEGDNRRVASIESTTNRYNLRPNRPTTFREKKAQYRVDRSRFPHFFRSYKNHLKLHTESDEDYIPPSHSPTPDSSDRSPSAISSQLSSASSSELFGLEACSPKSSKSQHSDASSLEFFSREERSSSP